MLNSLKSISDIYASVFIDAFMLCDIVSTVCGKRCWKYDAEERTAQKQYINILMIL